MDVKENTCIQYELERVGQILANRRAELNLDLAEVSATLYIKAEYLDAIENADLSKLPAPPYIIGFVRSYANYLNLPAARLCQEMHQALSNKEKRPEFEFIENKVYSPNSSGRVALVSVLAGGLLYAGWYMVDAGIIGGQGNQTAAVTPPQIEAEAPLVVENTPSDGAGEPIFRDVEPRQPEIVVAEPSAPEQAPLAVEEEQPPVVAETAPADPAPLPPTAVAENGQETETPAVPATISAADAVARDRDPDSEMVITAIGTSWVELNRADGSKIAAWLMRSGEVYTVTTAEDVYLTTGNAGGLSIVFSDGSNVIPGNWGETLRELPLDPQLISEHNQ